MSEKVELLDIHGNWITAAADPRDGYRSFECVYRLVKEGKPIPIQYWAREDTHYTDPTGRVWDCEGNHVAIPEQGDRNIDYGSKARVVTAILHERDRQEELKKAGKFPWTCADTSIELLHQYHVISRPIESAEKLAVLAEEFGEVSRVVAQSLADCAPVDRDQLRTELTQVAAVCVAWLEALDDGWLT